MAWIRGGLAFLLILAGCGREPAISGPAAAGALQCAIDHGRAGGYEVSDGSVARGFVRLSQRLPPPPVQAAPVQPRPDLADVVLDRPADLPVENQILVVQYDGRLEITVAGFDDEGVGVVPGGTVEDQARTILALCTTDPSAAPAPADDL